MRRRILMSDRSLGARRACQGQHGLLLMFTLPVRYFVLVTWSEETEQASNLSLNANSSFNKRKTEKLKNVLKPQWLQWLEVNVSTKSLIPLEDFIKTVGSLRRFKVIRYSIHKNLIAHAQYNYTKGKIQNLNRNSQNNTKAGKSCTESHITRLCK